MTLCFHGIGGGEAKVLAPKAVALVQAGMNAQYDVIVIGAGIAGLAAAKDLAARGAHVLVLEARARLGGRIHSVSPKGWPRPVELGAEFVHDGNEDLWRALKQADVRAKPVPDQHWLIRKGRRDERPDVWDRIDAVMNRIGPKFRGSFGEWLQRHGDELREDDRALAETYVQGFQGAPLARMSANSLFKAAQEEEEQLRPANGYQPVIDAFATALERAKVEVQLRSAVTGVEWRRGEVIVKAGARKWRTRAVLVTVPLGVLRLRGKAEGAIRFNPPLAAKAKVVEKLEPGHALRLVLRLRADAWRRGPISSELRAKRGTAFGFLHSEERYFPVWWSLAPDPILVGWTGGPAAGAAAGWKPEKIFREGRRTLSRLLGIAEASLNRLIVDWRTHDWAADPFTRGAYSFSTAGLEHAPQQLAKPVADTLFFAGEATAEPLELGTVQGALSSGRRGANEIAKVLRLKRR